MKIYIKYKNSTEMDKVVYRLASLLEKEKKRPSLFTHCMRSGWKRSTHAAIPNKWCRHVTSCIIVWAEIDKTIIAPMIRDEIYWMPQEEIIVCQPPEKGNENWPFPSIWTRTLKGQGHKMYFCHSLCLAKDILFGTNPFFCHFLC